MKFQQLAWALLGAAGTICLTLVGAWGLQVNDEVLRLRESQQATLQRLATVEAQYIDLMRRLDKIDSQLDRIEAKVSSRPLFDTK